VLSLSKFGQKLCDQSGIVTLMDDLGDALRNNPDMIFMGGGNPAIIPEVQTAFSNALNLTLNDFDLAQEFLGVYQPPQGDASLLDELAELFQNEYQWPVTRDNIALANGSQSAFFVLFNLFAGEFADGSRKQIQFPLAPEYLGYSDLGISEDFFTATKPGIELLANQFFKYHVDFSALKITEKTGAICVSRPTNPTGNVISDDELQHLDLLAKEHQIPFIIDGAYGTPFPHIIFSDATPFWNDNIILVLSLSKLGLPGARTGIVIANPEVIRAFAKANTILSLATGNFGPAILRGLLKSGQLLSLSKNCLAPFYQQRMQQAVACFQSSLKDLPYRIHQPEGAIFLWLWFSDLPISSQILYERLKHRGVLVVSGHHFFPGLNENWSHIQECIRVTYCLDPEKLKTGADIIAQEVARAYAEASISV
jgi:valine--pyruvate aminotransferase